MKHPEVPKTLPFKAYVEGADYTIEEVTVLAYTLQPGASISTFIIREPDGRTYQSAVDYFFLTRAEIEEVIVNEIQYEEANCLETIKECHEVIAKLKAHPLYRKS